VVGAVGAVGVVGAGGVAGAGPGSASTLADGFANPVTASALVTSREGVIDPADLKRSFELPEPARDATAIERWEPWVRAGAVQQVLLEGLRFQSQGVARTLVCCESADRTVTIVKLVPPTVKAFRRQLPLVLSWAELREERSAEILAQIENQSAFVAAVPYLHPSRTPRTLELLGMAIQLAVSVEMRFKHELACWRPIEYSPHVQPMITTPGHGSLPSGHATQAYILAHVLQRLLDVPAQHPTAIQLQRQAARIATNRVVAGVHFPIDSIAGRLLGWALGEYFLRRCGVRPKEGSKEFVGRTFNGAYKKFESEAIEFIPGRQPLEGDQPLAPFYGLGASDPQGISAHKLLEHCWTKAAAEWQFKTALELSEIEATTKGST
jgi:membrane-associated phospholipid phosphatase